MAIVRSARGVIVVDAVEELFPALLSASAADTVAVLLIDPPAAGAVTAIAIEGAAPTTNVARVHVTVPAALLQAHPVPVALTKVVPAGSGSTTDTLFAVSGPPLLTASV